MHVINQKEVPYSWISKTATVVSGGIILAILFYSNLSEGAVQSFPLLLTRFLVVAALLVQIPLLFSEDNYLACFPRFFLIPVSLFLVFLFIILVQCFYGLRILEFGVGTVNPNATFSSLDQLICYFFFFILCVKFISQPSNVEKLVFAIAVLVCVITVWGIAERFIGRDLLGMDHLAQDSFGPFVNPNHYSAFIGLTLPLFFAHLHDRWKQKSGLSFLDSSTLFLLFLTALTLVGCFLSGSRMGILVIAFLLILYLITQAIRRNFKLLCFAALVILGATLLVLRAGEAESFLRTFSFDALKAALTERLQVSKESLGIFFQYPLLGSGLGTYAFISPKVISVMADSFEWNHVHNDYVELLVETGAIGFSLFIGTLATLFFYGLRHCSMAIQAVFAVFIIAIFELADFPLKIPSLAFLFVMQLAFVAAIPGPLHPPHSVGRIRPSAESRAIGAGMKVLLFSTFFCGSVFLSIAAVNDYQGSKNSAHWHELGLHYLEEKNEEKALEAFREAAHLSPTYSRYWFSLGRLEYQEGFRAEGLSSLEKAIAWAPYKSGYSLHLIAVYLKERSFNRAKELFDQLSAMKNFPTREDQQRWMGPVYAKKFGELMLEWNADRKVSL